ncbi:alanine racemase [Govanella unica]|uniref:Alanine racemase n=1 Tax=Govanella unica TaxID=2975056 RepID=A0A9X3TY45_9PROT|nr:alanine racemase [Govania unica]MDA5194136.1 alanine racemase [Govania unica]
MAGKLSLRSAGVETDEIGALSRLVIDVGAIRENYRMLRARVAPASIAAVVKADCYGLGAVQIVPVLYADGCRHFFVAQLAEGLAIRGSLPEDAEIYILNGLAPGAEAACAAAGLVPVLNGRDQLDRWGAWARGLGLSLPAVLQLDSGMSRLGLSPAEVAALTPAALAGLDIRLVMSHLACADEPEHPANRAQLAGFEALRARLPAAPASFANSAGIFLGADYHYDLARPGAALYGLAPVAGQPNPMLPVVRLEAQVIQIRDIPAGAFVGYGASFVADKVTRVATISLGYADGWPRHLSNCGAAYIKGQRLPILGRVSMDSITLDVSEVAADALRAGDFVELLGASQAADDVARDAGTNGYEILTSLGRRHHRVYEM